MQSTAATAWKGLDAEIHDVLVATSDGADPALDEAVPQVLRLIRDRMRMDVVFVSEFTEGRRVFRHVDEDPGSAVLAVGAGDALEDSWCQRVVDGRVPQYIPDAAPLMEAGTVPTPPFPVGTHISTPIVLPDGSVYGTLCCFSFGVNPQSTQQDLEVLRYAAQLTANIIGTDLAG